MTTELYDIIHLGGDDLPPIITLSDRDQHQLEELLGLKEPEGGEKMEEEEEGDPFDPVPELTNSLRQMPSGPPPPPPPTSIEATIHGNQGGVNLVAGIHGPR